jgi:uncharacterized protein (DUF3084 family)
MTAGYILIIVMLILGGVIATLSDRLGTKVGKARLSLFKLRPRNTAVLVTVLTGSVLSAMTLGVLFAASKPLRTGVFGIDQIQKRLNAARKDLNQTTQDKVKVEAQLVKARAAQARARASLDEINRSLQAANAERTRTEAKLNSFKDQLKRVEAAKLVTQKQLSRVEAARLSVESQLNRTQGQLQTVSKQKSVLRAEIAQLQSEREALRQQGLRVKAEIAKRDRDIAEQERVLVERDRLIATQDRVIADRNAEIAVRDRSLQERNGAILERDRVIAEREKLLQQLGDQQAALEDQQTYLQQQVQILERDFQAIRSGTVAIRRGQILAAGVVRILEPTAAPQAIDRLLQEANLATRRLIQPGKSSENQQVIDITKVEVEQLIAQIKDGQDYVVRILAGANYLQGEKRIQVFAEADLNRVVFRAGDVVAGTSINTLNLTGEDVRKKMEKLIDACNFRASFVGIVGGRVQIADDKIETLLGFIERLHAHQGAVDVQAIAADVTYTAGPLRINLVAISNGVVLFSTGFNYSNRQGD